MMNAAKLLPAGRQASRRQVRAKLVIAGKNDARRRRHSPGARRLRRIAQ